MTRVRAPAVASQFLQEFYFEAKIVKKHRVTPAPVFFPRGKPNFSKIVKNKGGELPAMKRAFWGSFLTAKPVLIEPIYKIGVSVPHQFVGDVTGLITRKRGRVTSSEQKGPVTNVTGFIPVSETFGLSADMRGSTSGHAFWQTQFDHWEKVPESISMEVIAGIRKRRGLPEEIPKANKYIDTA